MQRSRSLSPASCVVVGGGGAEQRNQNLEELLELKVS